MTTEQMESEMIAGQLSATIHSGYEWRYVGADGSGLWIFHLFAPDGRNVSISHGARVHFGK